MAGTIPRDVRVWPICGQIVFYTGMGPGFVRHNAARNGPGFHIISRENSGDATSTISTLTWQRALYQSSGAYGLECLTKSRALPVDQSSDRGKCVVLKRRVFFWRYIKRYLYRLSGFHAVKSSSVFRFRVPQEPALGSSSVPTTCHTRTILPCTCWRHRLEN